MRSRPHPRRAGAAFLALTVALTILLGACGQRPKPIPLRTVPFTDVNPYGVNVFLDQEVEEWKIRRELQMIKDAGVGWVKQEIPWFEIEPQKGKFVDTKFNKPSWQKYDKRIRLIDEFGLQAIVRLDQPPNWTRKDNSLPDAPPDNYADYGNFVYDVVKHLSPMGIRYYQLWNEPNIYPEWGNHAPDPAAYTRLLKAGYLAAKRANPNAVILSAPLAITLENSSRNMSDLTFLQGMYAAGAKQYFDIMSANAYGLSLPPTDPPDPNKLNFQRVRLLHRVMVKNGDANKPVWFDEFGWNASPATMAPDKLKWGRVTPEQQAQYTTEAITMARSWPWVGVINLWYFRQDGTRDAPTNSEYYFRMVNPDFSPTPLYAAIKKATVGVTTAQPGSYEETDPGLQPSDDGKVNDNWTLRLDPHASGGSYLASDKTNSTILIHFHGDSISLKTLQGLDGGIAYVSIDGSSTKPNKLKRNSSGKAVLNFYSAQKHYQRMVPIANGLSFGNHVLQLVIPGLRSAPSHGNFAYIDGFTVGD
ncbi:MAG: glycoside hydrolase 5 family protein [Chloroflexota bacterium]